MVLTRAEDRVGDDLVVALEDHFGAQPHHAVAVRHVVDEAGAREPQLKRSDELAHIRLLELGRVVLGVLAQVAQLARLLDRGRDRGAKLLLQPLELLAEPLPGGPRHDRDVGLAPRLAG